MGNGSGVSRGDRNRNARLTRLRALVPVGNAIVGIDLADAKQMAVVTEHDSKVLARKTFRCRAWNLGTALDWAALRASAAGSAGVTVACEPTGHRRRVLGQLAADRVKPFVCVQPMLSSWSRRAEDLTFDKTDEKDAVLIARLIAQLRCYVPEPVDETWGRLRHLGTRRDQLIVTMTGQVVLGRWRKPAAIHDPGKIVCDLAITLAVGGDCLADLATLRAEPGLFGQVASDPTVSRLIDTLATNADKALAALDRARAQVRARTWELAGAHAPDHGIDADHPLIVDLDATLVTAHSDKQNAAPTFKRGFGFTRCARSPTTACRAPANHWRSCSGRATPGRTPQPTTSR